MLKTKTNIIFFFCILGLCFSLSKNLASVFKFKNDCFAIELSEDSDINTKDAKEKETENSNELEFDDLLNEFNFISFTLFHSPTKFPYEKFILSSQNPLDKLTPPPKA